MPELPEVETIRLQLQTVLPGLIIQNIQVISSRSFIGHKDLVKGNKVMAVNRFGKMLVINLENGLSIAVHLKMTGQLILKIKNQRSKNKNDKDVRYTATLPNKHTRVIITFKSGERLFFNDMRRFGWIRIVRNNPINQSSNNPINKLSNLTNLIDKLGSEPLKDLTMEKFVGIIKGSNIPIKILLMDQEKLAGVGNIYANEALYYSGINPITISKTLPHGHIVKLFHCLIDSLKKGIRYGGASDNNYVNVFGGKGRMQEYFQVYKRSGKPCLKCGSDIKRIRLGGRGTFYCPNCQSG